MCNCDTSICMCDGTLVNSSYVDIGCDVPWRQFWPSTYDGRYTQLTLITLTLSLPKLDDYGS